jgi:hypothetical protein
MSVLMCCTGVGCGEPSLHDPLSIANHLKEQILAVDFGKAGALPWTAMHLPLGFGQSETFIVDGVPVPLRELEPMLEKRSRLPALEEVGLSDGVARGRFLYEYEDYVGQSAAYEAVGDELRRADPPQDTWRRRAQIVLECSGPALTEEPSWLVMLGAEVLLHADPSMDTSACRDRVRGLVHAMVRRPGQPACGACHFTVALALAAQCGAVLPDDDPVVSVWCTDFRARINAHLQADGYVELPGLDQGLHEITVDDRVRCLAHVVEVLSVLGQPVTRDECRIIRGFEMAVCEACRLGKANGRVLGNACYGIGGLVRMKMWPQMQ